MNTMLNKTFLASALLMALSGTVQAANPNEGSRTDGAARSTTPSPGQGSASEPSRIKNDGSRSTGHGALAGANARAGASADYATSARSYVGL